MANPVATDDSYPVAADTTLRVGQGEFVGNGKQARLRTSAQPGTVSSSPVAFSGTGVQSLTRSRSSAASLYLGAITPATITTLTFSPTLSGTSLPVSFAHAFKAGDVPAGASVEVFGRTTQFDALATHPDGSVRHAMLTAIADVTAGVAQIVQLRTRAPVGGAAISKADVLASAFSASVSLNVGGTVYSLSARDLLDGTITPLLDHTHLSGPLCSEFVVGAAVRNGATPHAQLTAYFHIRAFSSAGNGAVDRVRCHVVIENNWTFVANPGDIAYTPTIVVGGVTIFNTALTHYHRTRTTPLVGWWGGDPQVYAKHNTTYLQDTLAVPKYAAVTPTESFLNAARQSTAPMDNGDLTDHMADTGYHDDIGPLARWDAVYVVSGADSRAYNYMVANAVGAAAYSMHLRDEATLLPVTIDSYPNTTLFDAQASNPVVPIPATANPHTWDWAHQPSVGYLAYLVTGDYYHLEEMQFWSAYNLICPTISDRAGLPAYGQPDGGAFGVFYQPSERGLGWNLRSLAQAAAFTPDSHPLKTYFTEKLNNNFNYLAWGYVNGNFPESNALGALWTDEKSTANEYRGFMQHFMAWSTHHAVELGFTSAVPLRDYKAKFAIGLMGQSKNEFCFQLAGEYNFVVGATNPTYYTTFKQVYDASFPLATAYVCGSQALADYLTTLYASTYVLNQIATGQNDPGALFANLQIALAAAADSGALGARLAWSRSRLSAVWPNYADTPQFAVVPRTLYPAWHEALAANEWTMFANTPMHAVTPIPEPAGATGVAAVMENWSGGAYDTKRDRLILWGGGHRDYSGNEVYAFDLRSLSWSRLTDPTVLDASDPALPNTTSYYHDGTPASRHTYAALVYAECIDAFFSMSSGTTYGDQENFAYDVDSLTLSTNTWNTSWVDGDFSIGSIGPCSAYHPGTGQIWYRASGTNPIGMFDPEAAGGIGAWTQYGTATAHPEESTALIDSARNRFVTLGGSGGQNLTVYDLSNPTSAPTHPTTSGSAGGIALESVNGPGFVYDPAGDRYLAWDGGANVYALDPDTWVWSLLATTGVTPTAAQANGTYGRFAYVPSLGGIVVVNTIDGNVYFLKLQVTA